MEEFGINPDWVTARAGCTGAQVFRKIKEEVRRDVDIRNKLRGSDKHYSFKFTDDGDAFTVAIQWNKPPHWVTFRFRGDDLQATDHTGKVIAQAFVTMSQAGTCALGFPDDEKARACETWEFRIKALERLFFIVPNE